MLTASGHVEYCDHLLRFGRGDVEFEPLGHTLFVTVRPSGNGARSNQTADWPMRVAAARLRAPSQAAGPEAGAGATAERARCGQHPSNTSPGIGEDQHAGNTNKTAFPGTRRHDRYNKHAGPVTSVNAGELDRLPALVIRVQE